MNKNKQDLIALILVVVLFITVAFISYAHVDQSLGVVKYLYGHHIKNLLINYERYQHSFQDFIYHTMSLHPGNSESGWNTILYLWPLFIFSDLLGGLSLKTTHLFTITSSLIFLVLFYYWIRRFWGQWAALFSVLFLGFSAIFQEIARSGNYDTFSLLIAIIWILLCFKSAGSQKARYFIGLGFLSGILWYSYGLIRGLTLVALLRAFWAKAVSKKIAIACVFSGLALAILPGWIILQQHVQQVNNFQGPGHLLWIDRENILDAQHWDVAAIFNKSTINIQVFLGRMLGNEEVMDYPMSWKKHAHFLNPYLVVVMLIGILSVFKSFKIKQNQLLLATSLMIFIIPILTAGGGFNEPRRAIFYVIPIYCFIGIGYKNIFEWGIKSVNNQILKYLILMFVAFGVFKVIESEMLFVEKTIMNDDRDLGILAFAKRIQESQSSGLIYYVEKSNVYNGTRESDLLRFVLMDQGQSAFNVQQFSLEDETSSLPQTFLLAKGLGSIDEEIINWGVKNHFNITPILESAVVKTPYGSNVLWTGNRYIKLYPLKLYEVQRMSNN